MSNQFAKQMLDLKDEFKRAYYGGTLVEELAKEKLGNLNSPAEVLVAWTLFRQLHISKREAKEILFQVLSWKGGRGGTDGLG